MNYSNTNFPAERRTAGFSLIEIAVVLAIAAVLAGILTPFVANLIDEARMTRAARETQTIAEAIQNFNRNTGKWPIFISAATITTSSSYYEVLLGPGSLPSADSNWLPTPTSKRGDLSAVLELNTSAYTTSGQFAWRGPYLNSLQSDPWGHAYIVNSKSLRFGAREAGFVMSAGGDGIISTTFTQNIGSGQSAVTISGDDIVARIR